MARARRKAHLLWNLGVYGDALSDGQGFSALREPDRRPIGLAAGCPPGAASVSPAVAGVWASERRMLRLAFASRRVGAAYFLDTDEFPLTAPG